MSTKDETTALKVRIDDLEFLLRHMANSIRSSTRLLALAGLDLLDTGEKHTARTLSEEATCLLAVSKHLLRGEARR